MLVKKHSGHAKYILRSLLTATALTGFTLSAQAQSGLDEIVVTAQKRAQSAQDIGLSVAAFSGETMRDLGVDDAEGLLDFIPGTGFYEITGGGVP